MGYSLEPLLDPLPCSFPDRVNISLVPMFVPTSTATRSGIDLSLLLLTYLCPTRWPWIGSTVTPRGLPSTCHFCSTADKTSPSCGRGCSHSPRQGSVSLPSGNSLPSSPGGHTHPTRHKGLPVGSPSPRPSPPGGAGDPQHSSSPLQSATASPPRGPDHFVFHPLAEGSKRGGAGSQSSHGLGTLHWGTTHLTAISCTLELVKTSILTFITHPLQILIVSSLNISPRRA